MNKPIFIFIILILFVRSVTGQTLIPPGDGFQASFSTGNIQYKDFQYNGLRNNGVNISIGINYHKVKNSLNHEAGINFDAATLWNRYHWDNYCFRPALHYRLLASVTNKLQLGGTISYSSLYYLNEYFDSHHTYWLTNLSTGLSGCLNLPVGKRTEILIPFNLPLIGLISRPEADRNLILNEPDLRSSDILKRVNSNFRWALIGSKYFEAEAGIFLQTRLLSNYRLTMGYRFHYLMTNLSLRSQLMTNQIVFIFPFNKK